MTPSDEAEFVQHEPCPKCGSSDNLARYSDGHAYCFSMACDYYESGDDSYEESDETRKRRKLSEKLIPVGEPAGWKSRKITKETAKKWGFTRSEYRGEIVRLFNYRDPDTKEIIAQKVRPRDKSDMRFRGPQKRDRPLFGMHLWRDNGRKIVVTTGELDAMSVSQVQGHKWPVVSVPNGDDGAAKALRKNINRLEKFDEVILMFDMDESGQEAARECALLFAPGKCKIASLPLNDPNDMLRGGHTKELIDAIWSAKEYRPDGLVSIDEIMEDVKKPVEWGIPWFLESLTELTYGRRWGDLYAIGAGTGIGKTDFISQQMMFDITELGEHVGAIYLEQRPTETAKRVAGKVGGRRFHVPKDRADWTDEELESALEKIKGKITFYDNFGETDWEIVKNHIRYMAVGLGIRIFYLDHLTAMADTHKERESIEQMMKEMAGIAKELGVIVIFVSHLATPDGTPHEEGGRVMIRHFKGSRSIGFWSYFMFGLERNPHSDDEDEATTTTFRVLKDRYTGDATGETIYLGYDRDEGRLFERSDFTPSSTQEKRNRNQPFAAHEGGFEDDTDVPF